MTLHEQYLLVTENRSGEQWIVTIADDEPLDLAALVDQWIGVEFCGESRRDGDMGPSWGGDYYAAIHTDGRSIDSAIVWESAGFFITAAD